MAEQFDRAAWRHQTTAEVLEAAGQIDDAAYHYGLVGETAIKYALQSSGCEAAWISAGTRLKKTPMRAHTHDLASFVARTATEIRMYASGRLAAPLGTLVLSPLFATRFQGWHLDIRYADTNWTPVTRPDLDRFRADAADMLLNLVI